MMVINGDHPAQVKLTNLFSIVFLSLVHSDNHEQRYIPSLFTTMRPVTPLWDWMRFKVSSTSDCGRSDKNREREGNCREMQKSQRKKFMQKESVTIRSHDSYRNKLN